MKNLSIYLCLFLAASIQVEAGLTPPSSNRDAIDDFNRQEESPSRTSRLLTEKQKPVQLQEDEVNCEKLSDSCISCLNLGHCKFILLNNSQTACNDTKVDDEKIMAGFPGLDYDGILKNAAECPADEDDVVSTIKPKFDTSLTPENQTTSSTTESTTQTSITSETSTTQTSSTSSSTSTTSASSTTSTTTAASTTTASTSTTTATPTTTQATPSTTPVDPSGKSGSKFDGWSFFGGILLTIGLSAIGFISFKYYKVRTAGQAGGASYNRF